MNALSSAFVTGRAAAPSIRLRVLSLGAGVQSTTLALMAAHGEIGPMPDCAVFANTGWEQDEAARDAWWDERRARARD